MIGNIKSGFKKIIAGKVTRKIIFSFLIIILLLVVIAGLDYFFKDNPPLIISLILITLILTVLIAFFLSRSISNPLEKIQRAIEQLERGNYRRRIDIRTGDEFEQIGNAFNRATVALGELEKEHKQLENAKTEFLPITSHELRSPMTPMKAQLQMLMGDYFGKLNDKQKQSLDIVLRNTIRLDGIIQDFLEVSRIESARLKFQFIKTDLTKHVKRLVQEMHEFLPEKNIKLYSKIGKLPVIEIDPDRVMQVLRNLINNAKKFSPENSKILITTEVKQNMIEFSVKDEGVGIKMSEQRKIFEPFYQVDNMYQHKSGGTGLGLAIVKGIVESQNGDIWVESQEGKGTTFYFTVPLKPVRKIKSIKLLFSMTPEVEKKIKNVILNYLGPIGSKVFEEIKEKDLQYEIVIKHLKDLNKKKIIDKLTFDNLVYEMDNIFQTKRTVKREIDVSKEIKELYVNIMGPFGNSEFKELIAIDEKTILENIDSLEIRRILEHNKAEIFRDKVTDIFTKKYRKEKGDFIGTKELMGAGFVRENIGVKELKRVGFVNGNEIKEKADKKALNNVVKRLVNGTENKKPELKEIKDIYIEILGPSGKEELEKIKDKLTLENINKQIGELKNKNIINDKTAEKFKNKIRVVFEGWNQKALNNHS